MFDKVSGQETGEIRGEMPPIQVVVVVQETVRRVAHVLIGEVISIRVRAAAEAIVELA